MGLRYVESSERGNLMLVLVLSVLAFVTVSLTSASYLSQLSIARGTTIRAKASSAGESVTNLALIDFQLDPTFGTPAHPDYSKVYSWTAPNGAIGTLVFDPAQASALDIPCSTNNFDGAATVVGASGFDVPVGSVELIGRGVSGATVQDVRHLAYVPAFAYVVATNGSFESSGSLLVGELPEGSSPATVSFDDLLPGHMGAGGNLSISGTADIMGNLQAGGAIVRSGDIDVRGEVHENRPLPLLPVIDIEEYRSDTAFTSERPGGSQASLTVDEHTLVNGSLNIVGALQLNSVILFIDGDLTVGGGATGVGAIICTGKVTFNSAASFAANEKIAILAKGDVSLQGVGAGSLFRGMVYTEGKFFADTITIIGCFVSNRPAGGTSAQIDLNDVKLLQQNTTFNLIDPWFREHCCDNADTGAEVFIEGRRIGTAPDRYEIRCRELTDPANDIWTNISTGNTCTMPVPAAIIQEIEDDHDSAGPEYDIESSASLGLDMNNLVDMITTAESSPPPQHLNFDFNQFLNMRDRVRTLYLGVFESTV
jgi:hypothetical protein